MSVYESKNESSNEIVNINEANIEDLLMLEPITYEKAKTLISRREKDGGFSSMEEVGRILNLKPHEVMKIKDKVVFSNVKSNKQKARIVDF